MALEKTIEGEERAKVLLRAMRQVQIDQIQKAINRHKNRPDLALKKIYKILGVD
jgi:hypothetical protein